MLLFVDNAFLSYVKEFLPMLFCKINYLFIFNLWNFQLLLSEVQRILTHTL